MGSDVPEGIMNSVNGGSATVAEIYDNYISDKDRSTFHIINKVGGYYYSTSYYMSSCANDSNSVEQVATNKVRDAVTEIVASLEEL